MQKRLKTLARTHICSKQASLRVRNLALLLSICCMNSSHRQNYITDLTSDYLRLQARRKTHTQIQASQIQSIKVSCCLQQMHFCILSKVSTAIWHIKYPLQNSSESPFPEATSLQDVLLSHSRRRSQVLEIFEEQTWLLPAIGQRTD